MAVYFSQLKRNPKKAVAIAAVVMGLCAGCTSPHVTNEMRNYVENANENASHAINSDRLRISYMVPDDEAGTLVIICTTEDVCQDAYRALAERDNVIEDTYRAIRVGLPGAKNQSSVSAVAWRAGFRSVDFEFKTDDGWTSEFRSLRRLSLRERGDR